jgi:hypothetical protein
VPISDTLIKRRKKQHNMPHLQTTHDASTVLLAVSFSAAA